MGSAAAKRLGVDFGRVISGSDGPEDTFLKGGPEEAVKAPAVPGAVEALKVLTERFEKRVWIVSKAGPGVQRKTLAWLEHNRFWERTGMVPWSVCFVLERSAKAQVARDLKLTSFIDDRLDVLEPMTGIVSNLYAFGHTTVDGPFIAMPDWTYLPNVV